MTLKETLSEQCYTFRKPENAPNWLLPELSEVPFRALVYNNIRSLEKNHPCLVSDYNVLEAEVIVLSDSQVSSGREQALALPGFPHLYLNDETQE